MPAGWTIRPPTYDPDVAGWSVTAGTVAASRDRNRRVMVTMAENVEKATKPQLAELVQFLVERVQAKGRTVEPESIEWTPPARPFFEESALLWRPRTDSNRRRRP